MRVEQGQDGNSRGCADRSIVFVPPGLPKSESGYRLRITAYRTADGRSSATLGSSYVVRSSTLPLVNRDQVSHLSLGYYILTVCGLSSSPRPTTTARPYYTGRQLYIKVQASKPNAHGSKPWAVKPCSAATATCHEGTLVHNAAVGDQRLGLWHARIAWHALATLHPPTLSTRSW